MTNVARAILLIGAVSWFVQRTFNP